MKQVVLALTIALTCGVMVAGFVTAQQAEDIKPGQTFPKPGYFPDPNKVVYVIFWHHKKQVDQFGYQDFFMNQDGVNDTTARKIKALMEKRYPNLVLYVKETNERDVESVVEREKKRIKIIDTDWVDVKQPAKIQPPQKVGDKKYDYSKLVIDESAPKGSNLKLEGTVWGLDKAHPAVRFEGGGKCIWVIENGMEFKKDWKKEGNKVYCDFGTRNIGTINEDGTMSIESFDGGGKLVVKSTYVQIK
jgi:hypothetical protein